MVKGENVPLPTALSYRQYLRPEILICRFCAGDRNFSLLGYNKGVNAVMHYRKMSNQILADETRRAREAQTRIQLANLEGWGEDYEQIRQDG